MEFVDQQAASPSLPAADEDPAVFLQSIRELTAKREREDSERFKNLEEEVKRTREEERAQSVSPDKTEIPHELLPFQSPVNVTRLASRAPVTPPSKTSAWTMDHAKTASGPPSPTKDIPEFKGFGSARNSAASTSSIAQTHDCTSQTPQSATSLAKSGTLSWQRRPASTAGSRPSSGAKPGDINVERKAAPAQASEPNRDQIAASLDARDPSWFRQTPDRGIGSAAYRKSKDESSATDLSRGVSGRKGLPGMSRETKELERQSSPAPSESMKSDAITWPSSTARNSVTSSRFSVASSSASAPSKPDLKSLIAEDAQQQEVFPLSDADSSNGGDRPNLNRKLTMSSSQARLADQADRPSSPTKGMGGFVSSAMMKRSESVSKRWSAASPPSLSRHGSVASVRNGLCGLQGSNSMPKLEPTADGREGNSERHSSPTTKSSTNLPELSQEAAQDDSDFVKPVLPRHNRSKSVASNYTANEHDSLISPPGSPSKRFSPSKSSWIESALTQRSESPKPNTAKNSQPSWMANIAKAKAERGSSDVASPMNTPKPTENGTPARGAAPFGQGILKRSDSRGLAPTPRSSTPPIARELHELPDIATSGPSMSSSKAEKPEPPVVAKSPSLVEPFSPLDTNKKAATETTGPSETAADTTKKPGASAKELEKTPSTASVEKAKPAAPAKPQTDFRSTLRSRPPPETKQQDTPEFLSKFGQLRKTQTEKYVAPDVLKNNITRGRNDLTKTGGPVKSARRDELKESLLAKKNDWKKAKDEGRELPGAVHERKISATIPLTSPKPEALARRELLAKQNSGTSSPEKPKQATPEALARQKSLKEQPNTPAFKIEATFPSESAKLEGLSKQTSAPTVTPPTPQTETSKLASRFNLGLAGLLARGPPASASGSSSPARTSIPSALPQRSEAVTPAEGAAEGPLQDMRKGRAKGPKKRKQGGSEAQSASAEKEQSGSFPSPQFHAASQQGFTAEGPVIAAASTPLQAPKPRAPPGSAASVMMASLRPLNAQESIADEKPPTPTAPSKSPRLAITKSDDTPQIDTKQELSTFTGFGGNRKSITLPESTVAPREDDKEKSVGGNAAVKSAASGWVRQASPKEAGAPPQIQLPNKKDEEAAMRSAGLLASSPMSRSPSRGLGIDVPKGPRNLATPPGSAGLPPKPTRSSRIVSGQMREASPNKSRPGSPRPLTEAERVLARSFGSIPRSSLPLKLDTRVIIASSSTDTPAAGRTTRRTVQVIMPDGTSHTAAQQDEYTLHEDGVYVCQHSYVSGNVKKAKVYVWRGRLASDAAFEQGKAAAKKIAYDLSAGAPTVVDQGHESSGFIQMLGGIMITRRGGSEGPSKQFMLCGRKHLGHIAFDEVDFDVASLCAGFVYLISHPVTLQHTRLYLWKGSACSTEEISAARLAAMDNSETGEIIEVDNGAEFASFLRIFGVGTTKASVPKASPFWRQKALAPDRFEVHVFRIQQVEEKPSLFTSLLNRRPSWNGRSPARDHEEIKVAVKHISPFCQGDLEAEGVYLLDSHCELYLILGPLFASQPENVRDTILAQALLFAAEYVEVAAEERPMSPKAHVLFRGFPSDMKLLFRHWDEQRGLWGTAGLMAGMRASLASEVKTLPVDDVLKAICQG